MVRRNKNTNSLNPKIREVQNKEVKEFVYLGSKIIQDEK